jgi:hypothetical protein
MIVERADVSGKIIFTHKLGHEVLEGFGEVSHGGPEVSTLRGQGWNQNIIRRDSPFNYTSSIARKYFV